MKLLLLPKKGKNNLIAKDPSCENIIKPWLRGKDIRRWVAERSHLYFLFIPWHFEINRHPAILQHLKKFKNKLENRNIEERDNMSGMHYNDMLLTIVTNLKTLKLYIQIFHNIQNSLGM